MAVMESENQLEEDALTGCKILRDRSEEAWRKLRARFNGDFCVIYADIDDLKIDNDHLGINFGDKILLGIAGALHEALSNSAEIYRVGGDEFLIFLPNCTRDEAIKIAEAMRQKVDELEVFADEATAALPSPSATFGVACATGNDWDLVQLIHRAENALSAGKERGKNQVSY